jgi:hypothetical protein
MDPNDPMWREDIFDKAVLLFPSSVHSGHVSVFAVLDAFAVFK